MADPDALVDRAALALRPRLTGPPPTVLVTLGSGLGGVADAIEDPVDIPMAAVPGLPMSTVPGHQGVLRYGRLGPHTVLAQRGRVHLYEGQSARAVTRVVEVAAALGVETFVVTNAAGGIDPSFTPGGLMLIEDHLNLTGVSPLTRVVRGGGPVFLDMAEAYDHQLGQLAQQVASEHGVELERGVYAGLPGPAYETPAEVRMLRTLGAQAVGMSTVLEVIAARSHGMRVLGLSSITNVHGPGVATSHEEVLQVGGDAAEAMAAIVLGILQRMPAA